MMLYPPMSDLVKKVDSRYMLVNVVARRAREISAEAERTEEYLEEKSVSIAIREIAEGKVSIIRNSEIAEEAVEAVEEADEEAAEEETAEETEAEEVQD
ncbi:MAG: DNA-directed RNA polymerase subunit omega [Ruminococcaceae bacterium]|nr:DNA-directed RNA polymerase subunit omega [Oscillospiraceae bacterium]